MNTGKGALMQGRSLFNGVIGLTLMMISCGAVADEIISLGQIADETLLQGELLRFVLYVGNFIAAIVLVFSLFGLATSVADSGEFGVAYNALPFVLALSFLVITSVLTSSPSQVEDGLSLERIDAAPNPSDNGKGGDKKAVVEKSDKSHSSGWGGDAAAEVSSDKPRKEGWENNDSNDASWGD